MGPRELLAKEGGGMLGHRDLKSGVLCVLRDHQSGAKSPHLDLLKSWSG